MIDGDIRVGAFVLVVVLEALLAKDAFLSQLTVEPFSELALLGPEMKVEGYPKNVSTNETLNLFLYLGNHEGKVMYYVIYVKLGDRTISVNDTAPADAPVIGTYEMILANGENRTIPVHLGLTNPMIDARLIFEMWIMDRETSEPKYYNRWLQLWMDVTEPAR